MTILAVIIPHTIQPYTALYNPIQPYATLYSPMQPYTALYSPISVRACRVSPSPLPLSVSGWALNMKPFAISESH